MNENKGKLAGKIAKGALKAIAWVLAVCVACGLLTACITGSLLAVDLVRKHGGSTYEEKKLAVVDWLRSRLKRDGKGDPAQKMEKQREYLATELAAMRDRQLKTDEMLLAELRSGAYGFDAPMIVNNPYGISPLTAVVLFQTEQPERVSIHIPGDTPLAAVDYTFDGYLTEHVLPVYGLYADRVNEVSLTLEAQDGQRRTRTLEIGTEALADSLSHERVCAHVLREAECQPGFTFTYRGNNMEITRAAMDVNGEYRWYLDLKGSEALLAYTRYCGNYNGGNSIFMPIGNITYGAVAIVEMNPLGKLLNAWYAPYGAHHDIEVTDDLLWVTGSTGTETKEDMLYALNRRTGEIDTVIDYKDILQVYRDQTQHYPDIDSYYSYYDWCHMNSVDHRGEDMVVSCRNQSTVLCNDARGNIKWMLCDPRDYFGYYQQYILRPVGEGFTYFYTQHAADVLPDQDGDPDTADILLFDNGDFRPDDAHKASRMVQYRVNEKEMTVEQIWSWGDGVNELYSYHHGDADLLPNGNRLGSFEPYDEKEDLRYAYGVEVNEAGDVVWECWRTSDDAAHVYAEYRLDRLEIYADSANDLMLGTPANVFIK